MPYVRPAVRVYQQLVSVSPSTATPFFELCVVGPVYQVMKEVQFPEYKASTAYSVAYSKQIEGSVIDKDSVICTLKNAFIKVWPSAVDTLTDKITVSNTGAVTKITAETGASFASAGVRPGDTVLFHYVDENEDWSSTVQSIDDTAGTVITLRRNVPTPEGGVDVTIIRPLADSYRVPSANLTVNTTSLGINKSLLVSVDGVSRRVFKGNPFVSYRALRSNLAGDFIQVNSTNDVNAAIRTHQDTTNKVEDVDIYAFTTEDGSVVTCDNPMAIACGVVFSNVNISYKVLPIKSDDKEGYLEALDLLTTNEKVYVLVPLSQDKDVITAFANHCKAMRVPEKSKWRITYGNLRMPSQSVVIELNDGDLVKDVSTTKIYLKDVANGRFITAGTKIGDFVDVMDGNLNFLYGLRVVDVLNDTVLEVSPVKYVKTDEGYNETAESLTLVGTQAIRYEVNRVLSTQGITDVMVKIANSYKNKGLRVVMPDTLMIEVNGVDYVLPGYYMAVAYGAMRAGFPPHQGFTTLGVGGIKRIFRSNKFFRDNQLDEMAGAGIFWVVQDEPDALPYCIYQTTTDNTQLETAEDSVVATIDFASKFYKDNLKAVLGKFNVNEISTKYVATVIKDVTEKMMRMNYPYIGPIIISGKLLAIKTHADDARIPVDTIVPIVRIQVPFPVNEVDLYLEV